MLKEKLIHKLIKAKDNELGQKWYVMKVGGESKEYVCLTARILNSTGTINKVTVQKKLQSDGSKQERILQMEKEMENPSMGAVTFAEIVALFADNVGSICS